jgi:hypothetical protein
MACTSLPRTVCSTFVTTLVCSRYSCNKYKLYTSKLGLF